MSIAVIGCGRSGTNMVLEMLRGCPAFKASEPPENKGMLKDIRAYSANYLTKCDTCYIKTLSKIDELIAKNPTIKFLFTIRDPRDMAMSKLRRGAPKSEGGDCATLADDATPDGCVEDIKHAVEIYKYLFENHSNRTIIVQMEDVLKDTKETAELLCDRFDIKYCDEMLDFPIRMRLPAKKKRYKTIDKGQIALWKYWQGYEDGWLKKKKFKMHLIFNELYQTAKFFGYE